MKLWMFSHQSEYYIRFKDSELRDIAVSILNLVSNIDYTASSTEWPSTWSNRQLKFLSEEEMRQAYNTLRNFTFKEDPR